MKRTPSKPVTPELAAYIKALLAKGLYQHQIAGMVGVNQGRISEINTGKRNPDVLPDQGSFNF
jgi:transcriptional regulator with XRE-family HTH domain